MRFIPPLSSVSPAILLLGQTARKLPDFFFFLLLVTIHFETTILPAYHRSITNPPLPFSKISTCLARRFTLIVNPHRVLWKKAIAGHNNDSRSANFQGRRGGGRRKEGRKEMSWKYLRIWQSMKTFPLTGQQGTLFPSVFGGCSDLFLP